MPVLESSRLGPSRVAFVRDLAAHGDRIALRTARESFTYTELSERVGDLALRLGTGRCLVFVRCANQLEAVVGYLAALQGDHPVLLLDAANDVALASLVAAYDPDVVLHADGKLEHRHAEPIHELHPDLALLLSTSGSTGSPKLVRLSHDNVQANAGSIADYLGIRDSDCAATSLPMHYSYGLSVINTHLLRGATLALTPLSVVDACFWELFREARCTTFAAVPFTFDLLERIGFERMELPSLRYVTQAGGRLRPDLVKHYADVAQRQGWELFVMYGQTEATARMAYLPPDLAGSQGHTIGRPIPGGQFMIEVNPDEAGTGLEMEIGELIYSGPNVMLGYAESPADLGLGRVLDCLRTGDLARRTADGFFEIVGRRNRIAKVLGHRIDLEHLETILRDRGITAACVEGVNALIVGVEGDESDADAARRHLSGVCGLPGSALRVVALEALPRLSSSKIHFPALLELGVGSGIRIDDSSKAEGSADSLLNLYAELLGRPHATVRDSFVSLGGDSLSYVEMSFRLDEILGRVPVGWHTMSIADLAAAARPPATAQTVNQAGAKARPRWFHWQAIEMSIALRALAILLIVGTHSLLFLLKGGAHVLLCIAGYNFARFHLSESPRGDRVRHLLTSIGRIALPFMAFVTVLLLLTDRYSWFNLFFLNDVLGPRNPAPQWQFWFIEVLVQTLAVLTAVMAIPLVDRLERRLPFAFPMALALAGLITHYQVLDLDLLRGGIYSPLAVFWLFCLGWAAARARTTLHRGAITLFVSFAVPTFLGDPTREALLIVGMLLLIWVPAIRVPRQLSSPVRIIASASLFIYLLHWQVVGPLAGISPALAFCASLATGIAYWAAWTHMSDWIGARLWILPIQFRHRPLPAQTPGIH